jgi:hypothetical protein
VKFVFLNLFFANFRSPGQKFLFFVAVPMECFEDDNMAGSAFAAGV